MSEIWLLQCDWGRKVGLLDDRELCDHRAVQRVMLHGAPEGQHLVQLCAVHRDRIYAETDPRQEPPAGTPSPAHEEAV